MNKNTIITNGFSDPESERRFASRFADEPALAEQCFEDCRQCGGCSFFAPFNPDHGLCCHSDSRHHLETISEHFTCPSIVAEGWGAHSFCKDAADEEPVGEPGSAAAASIPTSRSGPARPWWRLW